MATKKRKPCMEEGCERPKWSNYHRCHWCWLKTVPIEVQVYWAEQRLKQAMEKPDFAHRARVPDREWPEGKRWCSGCQWFVPLDYVSGSRCKACNSRAAHASHVQRTYSLPQDEYDQLLAWQGGVCFICGRTPRSRRLSVDHDHRCCPGEVSCGRCVRGLLCSEDQRGCNHAILGNIKDIEMARRIVEYLERPPLQQLRAGALPRAVKREAAGILASLQGTAIVCNRTGAPELVVSPPPPAPVDDVFAGF